MEIVVNGECETTGPCTIADVVTRRGIDAGALVVELNRAIVKQEQWSSTRLQAGDRLELLSFVGGG